MLKRTLLCFFPLVMFIFLAPLALVNCASEPPQIEWQNSFLGTIGYSVAQTNDGGYAIAGTNASASLLIRTDPAGNLLWSRSFELGAKTNLPHIIATSDDGFAMAGTLNNTYVIVKVDAEGNTQWNQSYRYDAAFNSLRAFSQTSDGGYILAGTFSPTQSSGHMIANLLIMKTDASGELQWTKAIIGPQGDFPNTIIQTSDGGYAVFGTSWASDDLPSTFKVIKTDAVGNELWNQTYGGEGKFFTAESSAGIKAGDGYLLSGVSLEKGSDWLAWLVKTDSRGNIEWTRNFGGLGSWALCAVQSQEGGYAFAGMLDRKNAWLVKIDSAGTMDWEMAFEGATAWGTSIEDSGKCLIQSRDGGYVLVGAEDSQIWLVKTAAFAKPDGGFLTVVLLVAVLAVLAVVIICWAYRRKTVRK